MRATITLTIAGPDVDRDKLRTIADAAEAGFKVDGWTVEECRFEAGVAANVKPGDRVRILGDSADVERAALRYATPTITFDAEATDSWLDTLTRFGDPAGIGRGYVAEITPVEGDPFDVVIVRGDYGRDASGLAGVVVLPYDTDADEPTGPERFLRYDEFTDLRIY